MKLSLSKKLIGGFIIVTIFAAILGGVGIYSITTLSKSTNTVIDDSLPAVTSILKINAEIESIVIMLAELEDPDLTTEEYNDIHNKLTQIRERYKNDFDTFSRLVQAGSQREKYFIEYKKMVEQWKTANLKFEEMRKELQLLDIGNPDKLNGELELFRGDHYKRQVAVENMVNKGITFEGGEKDDVCNFGKWLKSTKTTNTSLNTAIETVRVTHSKFHELVQECKEQYNSGEKEKARETADKLNNTITEFISNIGLIRTEIAKGKELMDNMRIQMSTECAEVRKNAEDLVAEIVAFEINHAQEQGENAKSTASFTSNSILIATGAIATLAILFGVLLSLNITRPIFRVIEELNNNSEQVEDAASQVSTSSQQLAQGATEQAAGLEETSGSIHDMAVMVKQNAENTQQANMLSSSTTKSAQQGTQSMRKMNEAIEKIQTSSEETSKIIKVIDEIAFQTNLLALNAAVEAARAGEAGKGFAVVAEEVRNLAMRSAEAARNTSNMIEESVNNAHNGVEICKEVDHNLAEITESVEKVSGLLDEVDSSCQEQTLSIEQISRAMVEMDKITQSNAASSEEGASAAEELSAQAEQMKLVVGELSARLSGETFVAQARTSTDLYRGLTFSDDAFHEIAKKSPEQIALEATFVL